MKLQIPDYHGLNRDELVALLDRIRASLAIAEDAQDFCLEVGELLQVNLQDPHHQ